MSFWCLFRAIELIMSQDVNKNKAPLSIALSVLCDTYMYSRTVHVIHTKSKIKLADVSSVSSSSEQRWTNARNVSQLNLYAVQHIQINLTLIHSTLTRYHTLTSQAGCQVRRGSFFECSHLALAQWLIIFFHWTTNTPVQLMAN